MKGLYATHKKKFIAVSFAILFLVGVALSPLPQLLFVDAYNAPPCGAGGCPGAIGVDGNNNVSVGTTTPLSNTKFLIAASGTSINDYALQVVGDPGGNTSLFAVRNDGFVGIGNASPGYTLTVNGDIYASGNLVGNISAGSITAGNISEGVFGANTGSALNSKYAFPSSIGINTSTQVGLPQALSVYGNAYVSTRLGVGTSSPAVPFEIVSTNSSAALRLTNSADGGTLDFYPGVNPAVITASNPLQINTALWIVPGSGVGINTSTPAYSLDVNGNFRVTGTSTFFGQVGVGTSSPAFPLDVSGTVRATGDICTPTVCLTSTGGINLSGTAGYLAKWSSASTLSSSAYLKEDTNASQVTALFPTNSSQVGFNIYNGSLLVYAPTSTNMGGVPASSTGQAVKMFFAPGKRGAFRAGEIDNQRCCLTNWDSANVGNRSFAIGLDTLANATNSVAMGDTTTASGQNAFAVGLNGVASGDNSFTYGNANFAKGSASFAGGSGNVASGQNSFAAGNSNITSGTNAFAFGNRNKAIAPNSVALGQSNIAGGNATFVTGVGSSATGTASIALGNGATANASSSVAIGTGAKADGISSIALGGGGGGNIAWATGQASVAIGSAITVSGNYSVGIGLNPLAVPTVASSNVMAVMGGNVGIGTVNPQSILHVAGPITIDATTITGTSYTLASSSPYGTYYANANGAGTLTITLPTPTPAFQGRFYTIVRINSGANAVAITAGGGGILGTTSLSTQYQMLRIVGYVDSSNASHWIATKIGP